MGSELTELFKEEEELSKEKELKYGPMDDRKCFLNEEQLEIFLDFKDEIHSKTPEEIVPFIDDNTFCRYLIGYKWNLEMAEKNIMNLIVSGKIHFNLELGKGD